MFSSCYFEKRGVGVGLRVKIRNHLCSKFWFPFLVLFKLGFAMERRGEEGVWGNILVA